MTESHQRSAEATLAETLRSARYLARASTKHDLLSGDLWSAHIARRESFIAALGSTRPARIEDGCLMIGGAADLNQTQSVEIDALIKELLPWRAGPLSLFGRSIASEWNSDLKWKRIAPFVAGWSGTIADIGSNDGYFIQRLLNNNKAGRELVVQGFEPYPTYFLQSELIRLLSGCKNLPASMLGVEDLDLFAENFDHILLMGIIYHRRDPYTCLQTVRNALRRNGSLLLETMVIPGEESVALCPPDRYAKMRNVWFMPTVPCVESWLKRAGFRQVECVLRYDLEPGEQRRSEDAPFESLEDFLDPNDAALTVEGLPAARRAVFTATR